jgi:hypothetical protein
VTEAEWMASDEPGAMLRWVIGEPGVIPAGAQYPPSDRKLKLWVEACRAYSSASDYVDDLCTCYGLRVALEYWGSRDGASVSQAVRTHLLRDIVGNPHRPVSLLPGKRVACRRCDGLGRVPPRITTACPACKGAGGRAEPCPWLTPTVVSLAHAAYDSRDPATGHLDPLTLAAVADALEEAGCAGEECPRCRGTGELSCPKCSGEGCSPCGVGANGRCTAGDPCLGCGGGGTGRRPHPILAHLRSPGPHVRGCHVVDLLTGRE